MPTETPRRTARLVLEDGSIFEGSAFGADATTTGEVVFNTAMCGYQEALTDPSYRGQVLVMTPSEVGNYGVAEEDVESGSISVSGFVVRELARKHSNHRAFTDLDGWMAAEGVPGIAEVDTRALVRRLRVGGAMRGILSTDASLSDQELLARARSSEPMSGRNLAAEVTPSGPGPSPRISVNGACPRGLRWNPGTGWWPSTAAQSNRSTDTSSTEVVRSTPFRSM